VTEKRSFKNRGSIFGRSRFRIRILPSAWRGVRRVLTTGGELGRQTAVIGEEGKHERGPRACSVTMGNRSRVGLQFAGFR